MKNLLPPLMVNGQWSMVKVPKIHDTIFLLSIG